MRYRPAVNGVESLVNTVDDVEHARVRRIFNPAFSDRALTHQAPLFTKYVNQLMQILRDGIAEQKGEFAEFDMVRMYGEYISRILEISMVLIIKSANRLHHVRYHGRSHIRRTTAHAREL